jgi:hypothetical protein
MKSINQLPIKFYQNLGKLFYAVAAADRVVREQEIIRLKEIIRQEWLPLDDAVDDFGTDAAYQMQTVFDWLKEHNAEADACLKSFKSFMDKHSSLFTVQVMEKIWKTVNSVASAFAGKNKSELIILNKINHLFDDV